MASKLDQLPLRGPVLEIGPFGDGRTRVTFRNMAAVYFLDEESPERDRLQEALTRSQETGEEVAVTYRLEGMRITGFQ